MTQSVESMIEVLQAHQAGKKVEYRIVGSTQWSATDDPQWQFRDCEYRIAPEPKKKVKLEAWLIGGILHMVEEDKVWPGQDKDYWIRVPSVDMVVEI